MVDVAMTPAMLERARASAAQMAANVELRHGFAEALPVPNDWRT